MSEFKFDDKIEASNNADFSTFMDCRFMADFRKSKQDWFGNNPICGIDKSGAVDDYKYARPATPRILIDGIKYPCTKMQAARIAVIEEELRAQYDIIIGEA